MSTTLIMSLVLLSSTLGCLVMNSWVMIWVMLEMNTLSFCALLKNNKKEESQKSNDMIMKYLVIQSIASAMLLLSSIHPKTMSTTMHTLMVLAVVALMMKAAASPLHQWFVTVTKKSKWASNFVLFTWQKLAPVYLMTFQMKMMNTGFILLSATMGALFMFNKTNLKEILAYSSVFNLGWMIMAITINTKILLMFSIIYWATLAWVIKTVNETGMTSILDAKKKTVKWTWALFMMSLGGLPPMMGFLAKWMVFSESLKMKALIAPTLLLVMSALNLFVYLRMTNDNLLASSQSMQKSLTKSSWTSISIFLLLSFLMITTTTL